MVWRLEEFPPLAPFGTVERRQRWSNACLSHWFEEARWDIHIPRRQYFYSYILCILLFVCFVLSEGGVFEGVA
jgi:hypothetical protein